MLSLRNYVPALFTIYVLILIFIATKIFTTNNLLLTPLTITIPLIIYFSIMVGEGLKKSIKYKRLLLILLFPFMAFITHFTYGIALIYGRIKSFL